MWATMFIPAQYTSYFIAKLKGLLEIVYRTKCGFAVKGRTVEYHSPHRHPKWCYYTGKSSMMPAELQLQIQPRTLSSLQ